MSPNERVEEAEKIIGQYRRKDLKGGSDYFYARNYKVLVERVAAALLRAEERGAKWERIDVGYALVDEDGDIPDFTYGQGDIHHIFTNRADADKFFRELGNKEWKIVEVDIVRSRAASPEPKTV